MNKNNGKKRNGDEKPFRIDQIDKKILDLLIEDSRMSYSKMGEIVGLSRVRVKDRISELKRQGVIERFTIQIPSKYLGKPLPVFFAIQVDPADLTESAQRIAEHPDIVIVYQMSGESALHVHGFFRDIDEVSDFTNNYLARLSSIKTITSEFLYQRFKANRSLTV
ncbi:MAG: Lrp/AsnC family transcriptional regulator [Desulfobacteraceae bacterium]|nr:Lrp/AsnC family transcriptional regulator [Desulfobacteraceae bacterium]